MSTTDSATVTMNQLASVIGRAASDPAFREQLVTSPASTLQSAGVAIPSGAEVKAVEESQVARYAVVPSRPSWLSDADLSQLVTQSLPLPSSVEQKIAAYGLLVAKSWADSSVRTELLANPEAMLTAHGISVPSGVSLQAIPATETNLVVTVPPSSVTVGDLASSIESSFSALTKVITAGSYLAGYAFAAGAILKFKQHADNPTQIPIGTPIALVFVAAALQFLPSILDQH